MLLCYVIKFHEISLSPIISISDVLHFRASFHHPIIENISFEDPLLWTTVMCFLDLRTSQVSKFIVRNSVFFSIQGDFTISTPRPSRVRKETKWISNEHLKTILKINEIQKPILNGKQEENDSPYNEKLE